MISIEVSCLLHLLGTELLINIAARTTTIVIFGSHVKEMSGSPFSSRLFSSHCENMQTYYKFWKKINLLLSKEVSYKIFLEQYAPFQVYIIPHLLKKPCYFTSAKHSTRNSTCKITWFLLVNVELCILEKGHTLPEIFCRILHFKQSDLQR